MIFTISTVFYVLGIYVSRISLATDKNEGLHRNEEQNSDNQQNDLVHENCEHIDSGAVTSGISHVDYSQYRTETFDKNISANEEYEPSRCEPQAAENIVKYDSVDSNTSHMLTKASNVDTINEFAKMLIEEPEKALSSASAKSALSTEKLASIPLTKS